MPEHTLHLTEPALREAGKGPGGAKAALFNRALTNGSNDAKKRGTGVSFESALLSSVGPAFAGGHTGGRGARPAMCVIRDE